MYPMLVESLFTLRVPQKGTGDAAVGWAKSTRTGPLVEAHWPPGMATSPLLLQATHG